MGWRDGPWLNPFDRQDANRVVMARVDWEPAEAVQARTAALLPALMLARVDGKSPVEYLQGNPAAQEKVRATALPMIEQPPASLGAVASAWRRALRA